MQFFRFSFWARFVITLCVFAAVFFSVYVVAIVLFSAPAPIVAAYDIAPNWSQAQANKENEQLALTKAQKQAEKEAQAAHAQQQTELATQNGITDKNELLPFFASADLNRGKAVFARCAACHTVNKGGGNRIGPNLWDINGRPIASHEDFRYSKAIQEYATVHKKWDLANLNEFIYAPKDVVPKTLMFYAGVKDLQERADLLLYLESLKD